MLEEIAYFLYYRRKFLSSPFFIMMCEVKKKDTDSLEKCKSVGVENDENRTFHVSYFEEREREKS